MQKKLHQIRDISLIEKELKTTPAGILAQAIEEEKVTQIPTTFLYLDKNIYLLLDENSDILAKIRFNNPASFAIIRNEIPRRNGKDNESYRSLCIMISGSLKHLDEQKLIDEVKMNYFKKYSKHGTSVNDIEAKAVMIDTEEIHAVEETGG